MATIASRITLRKRHSDQCLNEHVYTSGIVEHDDFFKPLFSGAFCEPSPTATVQGPYGATTTTGSGWKVGVIQVDIQVDANNNSTTDQRPPAAIVTDGPSTERIAEEVAEQGGTENPTGLLFPVNRGREEGADNEDEDRVVEGATPSDGHLIQGKVKILCDPALLDSTRVTFTYDEEKFLVYKLSDGTATLITSGKDAGTVKKFGEDETILFEGIAASDGVGESSLLVTLTGPGGGVARDRVAITVIDVNLVGDSNNDGTVEPWLHDGEESIEEYSPGMILAMDDPHEVEEDASLAHVGGLYCDILPEDLATGRVKIQVEGDGQIQVWEDESKNQEVDLPLSEEMSLSDHRENRERLYVSASAAGSSRIGIMWMPDENMGWDGLYGDTVAIQCVGPISRMPKKATIALWSGDPYIATVGADKLRDILSSGNVWDCRESDIIWRRDDSQGDDNIGECTLANFQAMRGNGAIYVAGHANDSSMSFANYKSWKAADDCKKAYANPERLSIAQTENGFSLSGRKTYFTNEWAAQNTDKRSIVYFGGCDTAKGTDPIVNSAGGRVRFGHTDTTSPAMNQDNVRYVFGHMAGIEGERQRTVKLAYDASEALGKLRGGIKWLGNENTTLGAAPLDLDGSGTSNLASPDNTSGKKGFGVVLFDTYMDTSVAASDGLHRESGTGEFSGARWISSPAGAFGLGFDFDLSEENSSLTMRVIGGALQTDADDAPSGTTTRWKIPFSGDYKITGANLSWTVE